MCVCVCVCVFRGWRSIILTGLMTRSSEIRWTCTPSSSHVWARSRCLLQNRYSIYTPDLWDRLVRASHWCNNHFHNDIFAVRFLWHSLHNLHVNQVIEEIEEIMQQSPDEEDHESPSQFDLSLMSHELHTLTHSTSSSSYEERKYCMCVFTAFFVSQLYLT